MAGGRPTEYTPDLIEKADHYAENYRDYDDVIPTVVGLCKVVGRSKSTIYSWKNHPEKVEFLDILEKIEEFQHDCLINGGLTGSFNPAITKMILTKHGYSDKIEQEHTSPDGSMTPAPTTVQLVTPSDDNSAD